MTTITVRVDADEVLEELEQEDIIEFLAGKGLGEMSDDRDTLLKIIFENENISLFDMDKINFLIDNISDIDLGDLEKLV